MAQSHGGCANPFALLSHRLRKCEVWRNMKDIVLLSGAILHIASVKQHIAGVDERDASVRAQTLTK
jgi:hypothetical protein